MQKMKKYRTTHRIIFLKNPKLMKTVFVFLRAKADITKAIQVVLWGGDLKTATLPLSAFFYLMYILAL